MVKPHLVVSGHLKGPDNGRVWLAIGDGYQVANPCPTAALLGWHTVRYRDNPKRYRKDGPLKLVQVA